MVASSWCILNGVSETQPRDVEYGNAFRRGAWLIACQVAVLEVMQC